MSGYAPMGAAEPGECTDPFWSLRIPPLPMPHFPLPLRCIWRRGTIPSRTPGEEELTQEEETTQATHRTKMGPSFLPQLLLWEPENRGRPNGWESGLPGAVAHAGRGEGPRALIPSIWFISVRGVVLRDWVRAGWTTLRINVSAQVPVRSQRRECGAVRCLVRVA